MTAPLFPLFADLKCRRVLVVGGGAVARRKVSALLEAGAQVVVGAPELVADLRDWAEARRIEYIEGPFDAGWLYNAWLVVAATDDSAINAQVAASAEARRIWANVVDDVGLSSVQIPARVERGPLQIAISSSGTAPMLARHLREKLEADLDESWADLATLLGRYRRLIRARFADLGRRRDFFETLLAGEVPVLLRAGRADEARLALRALISAPTPSAARGRVALVGAGPGDAGLLTLRALRVLSQADVVLFDRLVSADVLARVRRDAELIDVGKRAGVGGSDGHHDTQSRIHALMLEYARAGHRVVRLKGGDPFVFGRGGEELEFLASHGIEYEVVPGITAALACAAYAGIPLTHRDLAQSVTFATAHVSDGAALQKLPNTGETLVFYMGVSAAAQLQASLLESGHAPSTPVALVENGSRREQRVVAGHLGELATLVAAHAVQSPALVIVGEVAALATRLHWFGSTVLTVGDAGLARAA